MYIVKFICWLFFVSWWSGIVFCLGYIYGRVKLSWIIGARVGESE